MEIVTGAMRTLLPKLVNLLEGEYKLQKNVRGEIMFLKAELESMEAALLKVSEAPIDQPPDIQVKLWAKDVKDLSYDIEDSIDKFMVRIDGRAPKKPHSFMGFIHRSISLLTKANNRHKIGTEVKDIKNRIKEVSERRERYKIDNIVAKPSGPTIDSLRLSALFKTAAELVGVERKSNEVVRWLMEGNEASKQQQKIVSIVGFGGLGKTSLANVVHQKLKKQFQFEYVAFVSVSHNPNMVKIFQNMLNQLGEDNNIDDEAQLVRELRKFLQNKRYLIVIDDIWKKSHWENIKCALIENEYGSRVITTTRILDVAKQVGDVYHLMPLSQVDSRKLFYQRIFGDEDKCPPNHLEKVSENILKKCGGVPLAIITIASMLASQEGNGNMHMYWSKVYRSMGSGLEDSPEAKDMRRILSVSYYDLPPHLKTCLLYLGLYPEDYKINTNDLIWKWVGEGFVLKEQGKSLYEVGHDYFNQLVNKSLIQPVHIGTCVHDMVLDLITSLSNEENFLTTLNGQQPVSTPSKIRRLSLQTSNEEDVKQLSTMSLSHARSVTVFKEAFNLLPDLSSFPLLSALDLSHCEQVENHFFKGICMLLHLRYLCLHNTSVSEIPKEIVNLQYLQVLDISLTAIKELPSYFVQLTKLVFVRSYDTYVLPDGFGNLNDLQEMPSVIVESPTTLHDLSRLTELRHLDIEFRKWDKRYEEPFHQSLSKLINLKTIEICSWLGSKSDSLLLRSRQLWSINMVDSTISTVPRWMSSLSCLSSLAITLRTVGVEDFQVLGSIPSLSDLVVWVNKATQDRDKRLAIGGGYPFRCLTNFTFRSDAMELVFAQAAMQNLRSLYLTFSVQKAMNQFGDFDLGLENLSSLKHVSVSYLGAKHEEAEAAIRKALYMNPNKPTLIWNKVLSVEDMYAEDLF